MNWKNLRQNLINGLVLLFIGSVVGYVFFFGDEQDFPPATQTTNCPHLPLGKPTGTPQTNDFICRDIYALSSNDETKFADWVAYQLTPKSFSCNVETEREWQADPAIAAAETLEPEDYRGAHAKLGTDRGHQAPLGNFKCGNWQQTNYLSNITPQDSGLNQGPWRRLEQYERKLAEQYGEVFVITGPVYERKMPSLPGADESHRLPSGYFKIITAGDKRFAYYFDQGETGSYEQGLTSVEEIERRTRLNLF